MTVYKTWNTLVVLILATTLGACATTQPPPEPALDINSGTRTVALINTYTNTVSRLEIGGGIDFDENSDLNVSKYVETRVADTLAQIESINIQPHNLSDESVARLVDSYRNSTRKHWGERKTLSIEKNMFSDVDIISELAANGFDTLVVVGDIDAYVAIVSGFGVTAKFPFSATGVQYSEGSLRAYSGIEVTYIDLDSRQVIGKDLLRYLGYFIKLGNDVSQSELDEFKAKFDLKHMNAVNNDKVDALYRKETKEYCGSLGRYDNYSKDNKAIIKSALKKSVDLAVMQLEYLYLNTEPDTTNYFGNLGDLSCVTKS